jgi:radical SAM superfamily enzyme YgiQ (UPF0313 family)
VISTTGNPHILLVNPWIHDFAAYDYWAKPYGLLALAALLRKHGLNITYIDCLDRFHPRAGSASGLSRHGRGPYRKQAIACPSGLGPITRTYSRYGIEPEWFRQDLVAAGRPDVILVTSLMTYWYPGVAETILWIRAVFPQVPIVLGGIYARLCSDHARLHSGADDVVTDGGDTLFRIIERYTGYKTGSGFVFGNMDAWPYPAFDLQHRIECIPLLTTRGCPYRCAYCACGYLESGFHRRSHPLVVEEIAYWHHKYGTVDFAFYDDALLVDAESHALPMLEGIVRLGLPIVFHTPNAVHIRAITPEVAQLMYRAGFFTLRLGLETTAFDRRFALDGKVTETEFHRAVGYLKSAGFTADHIGAYLLVGLPGQPVEAVEASIAVVKKAGITPVLAYYTPIPHTSLWPEAVAASRYDLEADPIYSNNAIFPCQSERFSWSTLSRLKQLANA